MAAFLPPLGVRSPAVVGATSSPGASSTRAVPGDNRSDNRYEGGMGAQSGYLNASGGAGRGDGRHFRTSASRAVPTVSIACVVVVVALACPHLSRPIPPWIRALTPVVVLKLDPLLIVRLG